MGTVAQLWTLARYDLVQRVRDRSVVIFGVLVPLALITVFNLVFGDTDDVELRPIEVVASAPAGDELGETLLQTLERVDLGDFDITVKREKGDRLREMVAAGEAHLGITVPDGFARDLRAGERPTVAAVQGDGREIESQIVLAILQGTLDQFAAAAATGAAATMVGLSPAEVESAAQRAVTDRPDYALERGETSAEQLDAAGALVAGQSGLFLFFTVGFGVLGLVTERETGTLARLRSMPMPPILVVVAKALVSFLLGIVATSILLGVGGALFGVSFGSLPAVALLVVAATGAATSTMFLIARVAKTSEQAGVAQSIVAMVLGIAGGAFFPLQVSGAIGTLLELNPVAAFIRGLGITAGGGGVTALGTPLAMLLGFALVMLLAARVLPDRGVNS